MDAAYYARRLVSVLLADNPVPTVVGGAAGLVIGSVYDAVALGSAWHFQLPLVIWVVAGAVAANVRRARRRVQIPAQVEAALAILHKARRDGISRPQLAAMYRELFEQVRLGDYHRPDVLEARSGSRSSDDERSGGA